MDAERANLVNIFGAQWGYRAERRNLRQIARTQRYFYSLSGVPESDGRSILKLGAAMHEALLDLPNYDALIGGQVIDLKTFES